MIFKNITILAVAVLLLVLNQMLAHADDPIPATNPTLRNAGWYVKKPAPPGAPGVGGRTGAYGANRIIELTGGYTGVKGTFLAPDFSAGGDIDPNNSDPKMRNPHQTKPQIYLGTKVSGSFTVDAGITYEPVALKGQDSGWSTYANITLEKAGPEKQTVYKWYQSTDAVGLSKGDSMDFSLLVTDDGNVVLNVAGFSPPTDRYRNDPQGNPLSPSLYPSVIGKISNGTMEVRRVVAISQNAGSMPVGNGAYMADAHFTGGQVKKWGQSWSDWSTGKPTYSPRAYNKGHEHDGYQNGPIFMVNSTPPWNRIPTTDGPDRSDDPIVGYHSRYYEEGVDIYLLSDAAGDLGGKAKANGKSKPKGKG